MREITDAAQGKTFGLTTVETLQYALKHLDINLLEFGPGGYIPFKKQLPQYIRGVKEAAEWRSKMLRSQTSEEMRGMLMQLIQEHDTTPCTPS
jgi:tRNA-dihydrouridine synthase